MTTALAVPLAAVLLVACGGAKKDEPNPDNTVATATETSTSPGSATATTARTVETFSTFSLDPGSRELAKVRENFGSLAPSEFFELFTSCDSNGIPDSYACTGPEVGQFQFFSGDAKAASTTQLLTELRSSRVVEDSGDRIVGWSTLGTTAVITVVDNKRGLTMQQMVSSDKQDPRKRIEELGLATEKRSTTAPSETPEATPTATTPSSSS
ncbi:hypothetical protein [Corynebacterium epidermidicanis]|uniref:hypothetical protein n=1 Tax=Corynebacterium epidermidicanis TaxID=1050174 RepID=UPI001F21CEF0|nr:hypothetical protein [Corynebacterium epidermidicanis]